MPNLPTIRKLPALVGVFLGISGIVGAEDRNSSSETDGTDSTTGSSPVEAISAVEARGRAQLLHEVVRGALQIMHRDFFDADDRDRIPSASLEDMFDVVAEARGVEMRWLGVNARTMDSDHKPQDDFEKKAIAALSKGESEFESIEKDRFRFVGVIRLHNRCLKCHVPFRTSLEDRAAGLVISIPIRPGSSRPPTKNSH